MMMGRMPSVQEHQFSRAPQADVKSRRSKFNRSCGVKTTFDAGLLIPIFVDEALPGDTFNLKMSAFARMATPLRPLMDNLFLTLFFFAVPERLLWRNFKRFMGERDDPSDSTDFLTPQMVAPAGGYEIGSLSDYLGIPTNVPNLSHRSVFHRAYNKIYNDWFRDQNLQDSLPVPLNDGPDDPANFGLLRRGKRHDYFTSCLPWPQKGPAVTLPLTGNAPVITNGLSPTFSDLVGTQSVNNALVREFTSGIVRLSTQNGAPEFSRLQKFGNQSGLQADLSGVTAATINQLRQAFQIQRLYERDARGGTRYIEMVQSHFGVRSSDARLQRAEYLGGGVFPVHVSPIAQTSSTDNVTPQGNLAAIGTASVHGCGFVKSFEEHCVLLGLACVHADLNYQQGLNRMFSRRTRFDFYFPVLAHIGEQAVLNKEIFANGNDQDDNDVFGYQERFAEYRYKPSLITGKFRSAAPGGNSLDIWHLAQRFGTIPALNENFIQENPPIDRVIAVPDEPHFLFDGFFKLNCVRPMPVYSVPGLIDHF